MRRKLRYRVQLLEKNSMMWILLFVHRKQLLEAWESAEWESREAQIRALQEAQLKEFEDSIKAKHAQVPLLLSTSSCYCFGRRLHLRDR